MKYSIIIPGYNEGEIIENSIKELDSFLKKKTKDYEIIYSDDGSKDKSIDIVKKLAKKVETLKWIRNPKKGPGFAIKSGFKKADGIIIAYIDADLSIELKVLYGLLKKIESGYDIAVASKQQSKQKNYPLIRRILSKSYYLIVLILLGIKVDTQCGCKAFNREKLMKVMPLTKENTWVWETEIISFASKKQYKITEIPTQVIMHEKRPTRLKIIKDSLFMGKGLVKVFFRRLNI